jgi:hypothetical protein
MRRLNRSTLDTRAAVATLAPRYPLGVCGSCEEPSVSARGDPRLRAEATASNVTIVNVRWTQLALAVLAVANLAASGLPSVCPTQSRAVTLAESPCGCGRMDHAGAGAEPCGCGCAEAPDDDPFRTQAPSVAVLGGGSELPAPPPVAPNSRPAWLASLQLVPVTATFASSAHPLAARYGPPRTSSPHYLTQQVFRL